MIYISFDEFDLSTRDPKWPLIDHWPHNIDRVSQADAYA